MIARTFELACIVMFVAMVLVWAAALAYACDNDRQGAPPPGCTTTCTTRHLPPSSPIDEVKTCSTVCM